MKEFKKRVGEERLKQANIKFNNEVNKKIDAIVKTKAYQKLSNEEKEKKIRKIKEETKRKYIR
jgi:hypothetical protein